MTNLWYEKVRVVKCIIGMICWQKVEKDQQKETQNGNDDSYLSWIFRYYINQGKS